jgi:hypothetical protein
VRRPYFGGCSSPFNQPVAALDFRGSVRSQSKHWNVRSPLPPRGSTMIKKARSRGRSVVRPCPWRVGDRTDEIPIRRYYHSSRCASAPGRVRLWGKKARSLNSFTGGFPCASPEHNDGAPLTAPLITKSRGTAPPLVAGASSPNRKQSGGRDKRGGRGSRTPTLCQNKWGSFYSSLGGSFSAASVN